MAYIHEEGLPVEKVRALPAGTTVYLNGYDRYGIHWVRECTVVQSGKKKMLSYMDAGYLSKTMPIRKEANRWYTLEERYGR